MLTAFMPTAEHRKGIGCTMGWTRRRFLTTSGALLGASVVIKPGVAKSLLKAPSIQPPQPLNAAKPFILFPQFSLLEIIPPNTH